MNRQQTVATLGVRLHGHLKILEHRDQGPPLVLLDRRNAVHKENAAVLIVKALTDRTNSTISDMVFGNGGTSLDQTGTVNFRMPHVTGPNQNLYNPVYFQMVDDARGALPGNQMAIRHIANSLFTDMDIRCLIEPNQPFGQLGDDQHSPLTLKTTNIVGSPPPTTQFYFDEIGIRLQDGTLLTHVIFVPILKSASSLLEVVYTLRLAISPVTSGSAIITLQGVQAVAQVGTVSTMVPVVDAVLTEGGDLMLTENGDNIVLE